MILNKKEQERKIAEDGVQKSAIEIDTKKKAKTNVAKKKTTDKQEH